MQQTQQRPATRHSPSLYNYTANCRCSRQLRYLYNMRVSVGDASTGVKLPDLRK
jgi:hypothetical protein